MAVNKAIFKEYDIRGKYPKEINAEIARRISRAFIKFLKLRSGTIIVGYDKRPSSKVLAKAFINGLADSEIDIIDIGAVTTPELYFAVPFLKAQGGAMVTASHLAKNENGIKFTRQNAEPIGGKEIQKIYELTRSNLDGLKVRPQLINKVRPLSVEIKKEYLKAIGKFENNLPAKFDYDGDRLLIKGFRGDILGGILADIIAKKGDVVIYDLRCTRAIPEYFKNKGIKTIPSKVGHYNIKKLMREKKAVFGMEITGHYYFKDFHYCESPLYGLKILNEQKKSLTELARPFAKYFHSGVINIKNSNFQFSIFKEKYRSGAQSYLDGLTIEFSNWWFNIRPSHTEPILTLVVEAKTKEILEAKKKEIMRFLS